MLVYVGSLNELPDGSPVGFWRGLFFFSSLTCLLEKLKQQQQQQKKKSLSLSIQRFEHV